MRRLRISGARVSAPRPETLAKRLFRARLRERLPQFEELKAAPGTLSLEFAWRPRKRFICYISMQLHHRRPGFTIEMGWSRGEVESFFMVGTPRAKHLGERRRLGSLMEPPRNRWWWLFADEPTLPEQVGGGEGHSDEEANCASPGARRSARKSSKPSLIRFASGTRGDDGEIG
jgi:hypothetical protein